MGHFGILELALFNSDQDPNDSNIHPCCLIRYFYQFLQCLSVFFLMVKKKTTNKPTTYFSFGMKNANMKSSKQKET